MSFYDDARDLFGLSWDEGRDMLDALREEGFDPRHDSLYDGDWAVEAVDHLGDVIEGFTEWFEYELDPGFDGDDWIEPYEEYEFTVQYGEDT